MARIETDLNKCLALPVRNDTNIGLVVFRNDHTPLTFVDLKTNDYDAVWDTVRRVVEAPIEVTSKQYQKFAGYHNEALKIEGKRKK